MFSHIPPYVMIVHGWKRLGGLPVLCVHCAGWETEARKAKGPFLMSGVFKDTGCEYPETSTTLRTGDFPVEPSCLPGILCDSRLERRKDGSGISLGAIGLVFC